MTLLRDALAPTQPIEPPSEPPSDNEASNSESGRYGLGLGAKIGIAAGGIAFGVVCLLIAMGGGDETATDGPDRGVIAASLPSAAAESSTADSGDNALPTDPAPISSFDTDIATAVDSAIDESTDPATAAAGELAAGSSSDTEDSEVDAAPVDEQPLTRIAQLPEGMVSPPGPAGAPERYSLQSDGVLFMRGTVPDIATETAIVRAVEAVMGPGNAISEFTIDPDVPFDLGADSPVYTDERVLFEQGSAVIEPSFFEVIAPLPFLLQIQPNVTVTVQGHTDSVGNAEDNLVLSQQRVDAVRDWVISQGGDADRIIAVGLGETEPIADNSTEEGRAANRRVESIISGFEFAFDS